MSNAIKSADNSKEKLNADKIQQNIEYIEKLRRGNSDIESGKLITLTVDQLDEHINR